MKATVNFRALTLALFITLFVSYLLCIIGAFLFRWDMIQAGAAWLPGFTWPLTAVGFVLGLVWIAFYSVYFAALFAFSYNYVAGISGTK